MQLGLALLRGQRARAIDLSCSINCRRADPGWQGRAPHTLEPRTAGTVRVLGSGVHHQECLHHGLSNFGRLKRYDGPIAPNDLVLVKDAGQRRET